MLLPMIDHRFLQNLLNAKRTKTFVVLVMFNWNSGDIAPGFRFSTYFEFWLQKRVNRYIFSKILIFLMFGQLFLYRWNESIKLLVLFIKKSTIKVTLSTATLHCNKKVTSLQFFAMKVAWISIKRVIKVVYWYDWLNSTKTTNS